MIEKLQAMDIPLLKNNLLFWSILMLLFCEGINAQPWTFIKTDANHSIIIPASFSISSDTGNIKTPLYIGAFYDSAGTKRCAGAVKWEGKATSLTVYGAVDAVHEKRPGFKQDEALYLIVANEFCTFFGATPTFQEPDGAFIISHDRFKRNGISRLLSIKVSLGHISYSKSSFCLGEGLISPILENADMALFFSNTLQVEGLTGNINVNESSHGLHRIQVSSNTCLVSNSINIFIDQTQLDLPAIVKACDYTSLEVSEQLNYIQWSTGSSANHIDISQSGEYTIKAITNAGCIIYDTTIAQITSTPVFSLGKDTSSCTSVGLSMPSGNNYLYQWSTGESSQSISIAYPGGIVWGVVTDNECSNIDSINIQITSDFRATMPDTIRSCEGAISLMPELSGNYGVLKYQWSNGEESESINIGKSGHYEVHITNAEDGCKIGVSSFANIGYAPDWDSIITNIEPVTCYSLGSIRLKMGSQPEEYYLSLSQDNYQSEPIFTDLSDGSYTISLRGGTGCVYEAPFDVSVEDQASQCSGVVITPNEDGKEDTIYIECASDVYNRFGKLVTKIAKATHWGGKDAEGLLLPIGFYVIQCAGTNSYQQVSIIY